MAAVIFYLSSASALLALIVTWQAKTVEPTLISIAKFNLMVLPFIYLSNTFLGLGINKGHELTNNLPLMVATQGLFYNMVILLLSIVILGDKVSVVKALVAFALISSGIYLLKS